MADDIFLFVPKGSPAIDTGVSPSVTYDDGQIHAFDSADSDELAAASRLQTGGQAFDVSTLLAAATGLSLGGQTKFAAGSAAAPSITTTGDLNTGIYFPASDQLAAAVGGSLGWFLDSTGLAIGHSSPSALVHASKAGASLPGIFESNASTVRLVVGTTAATAGKRYYGFGAASSNALTIQALSDAYAFARNLFGLEHDGGASFYKANSTVGAVWDAANARIGINTTSPDEALHVQGNGKFGDYDGAALSGSETGMFFTAGGLLSVSRSGNPPLGLRRLDSDGSIASFIRQNTQVGTISVTGSLTTYNTTSDVRAKTNISAAGDALSVIRSMPVRQFEMRADGAFFPFGYIAQEADSFVPQMVTKGATEDDLWGVDHSKIVPALHRSIQQLAERVEALEAA
jgi:hypothetical protein